MVCVNFAIVLLNFSIRVPSNKLYREKTDEMRGKQGDVDSALSLVQSILICV